MDRRTFLPSFGLPALLPSAFAQSATPSKRRLFVLEQLFLKAGTQPARFHEYMKAFAPGMKRAGAGPSIYLEALVAPHMPQIALITQYDSIEQMWAARFKAMSDSEFRAANAVWENHDEPPYESMSITLLEATPYCPELQIDREPRKTPRIFELRVYHSPTWRQLGALHERFAGPEIKIFHRTGVRPILYTSTIMGQHMPNLTYLTPFDDLAAREKAWAAFGADPEWPKVRKESIDKHGQISSIIQISLYRSIPGSPIG